MPGRGTPHAAIRVPPDVWDRFGEAAAAAGTDRSTILREFIRWYLRDDGAKPPNRPRPASRP